MKYLDTKSAEIIFSVEVTNTGSDVVSGSVGTVIYSKASVSNPTYDFALTGAEVVAANGSIKAHTGVVFVPSTGYYGIVYTSPAVGDRVTFSGAFVRPSSELRVVGEKKAVKTITSDNTVSKGLTYDLDKTIKPITWETLK